MNSSSFSGLRAIFLNCSLKPSSSASHTQLLMDRSAHIMKEQGVAVEQVHVRDHTVLFGMTKDTSTDEVKDEWPDIQKKILEADICVIGSPIWLGTQSSVASLVIERMYAYSGDTNEKGQYPYYGKVGGAIITGNEDGVKASSRNILYALQHIGYTIPPQADCGWIGEIGPGNSYGDVPEGGGEPTGFDSEFTNKNTTIMTYNLLHLAKLLKDNGGIPSEGTTSADWKKVANAADADIFGLE